MYNGIRYKGLKRIWFWNRYHFDLYIQYVIVHTMIFNVS